MSAANKNTGSQQTNGGTSNAPTARSYSAFELDVAATLASMGAITANRATTPSLAAAGTSSTTLDEATVLASPPASQQPDTAASVTSNTPVAKTNPKRQIKKAKKPADDDTSGIEPPPNTPASSPPTSPARESVTAARCLQLEAGVRDLVSDLGLLKGVFLDYATPADANHRAVSEAGYDSLGSLFVLEDEIKQLLRRVQEREQGEEGEETQAEYDEGEEFGQLDGRFQAALTAITALRVKLEGADENVAAGLLQAGDVQYKLIGTKPKTNVVGKHHHPHITASAPPTPANEPSVGPAPPAPAPAPASQKRRSGEEIDREIARKRAKMQDLEDEIYNLRKEKEGLAQPM
ncbi:uncharacterized protein L3040_006400 [Drepanopeziza brunnea f. sp. 'multigermtubi']|uniref:Uncharacterized protein n=1 Tax=Marssonina brunnea f. sp. multigermtubi (strain MB_m1) TaxID=1072389 RepID=K1WSU4_MARBU|nr:uncharacterized protein MBM_01362 [Drepanopeziza brunnea f. sp. 'multigermtubi' MB_m1]EKD20680.1 hypothetical protein MBM_01362 [Drepanopeziza brunnea f. sp. 'multigermtubi' MB_m1]KAJ5038720.1 hypothetical protein L3040_006400 [Drepanopeziza brunnea f. sp. 'multigermtubi']